jgi:hypothetical protein
MDDRVDSSEGLAKLLLAAGFADVDGTPLGRGIGLDPRRRAATDPDEVYVAVRAQPAEQGRTDVAGRSRDRNLHDGLAVPALLAYQSATRRTRTIIPSPDRWDEAVSFLTSRGTAFYSRSGAARR